MDAIQQQPQSTTVKASLGPGFPRAWPMQTHFFADSNSCKNMEFPARREVSKAHVVGAHGLLKLAGEAGSELAGGGPHKPWLQSEHQELGFRVQQHVNPTLARSVQENEEVPAARPWIVGENALQTLEACRRHANSVEVALRKDIDASQEHVIRIAAEARGVEQVARDAVRNIEDNRKDHFSRSRRDVVSAEMQFHSERDEANAQLAELYQQLRDSQEACEERVLKIYEKWVRENAAAERRIRDLEQNEKNAAKENQKEVKKKMAACEQENVSLRTAGTQCVKDFKLRTEEALVGIREQEIATRSADLDAAKKAARDCQELRARPELNQRQMDLVIDQHMSAADAKVAELEADAAQKVADAKAHAAAANGEAARLRKETEDAWARLRAAHFELRRLDMHDFSQRINSGEFDEL